MVVVAVMILTRSFIQGFSTVAASLISMLKTSSSTDSSTSATQITVEHDEVDAGGKSVKKLSKSRRIVKKSKKPQRSEKFAKAIGSEEHLPKHWSSINEELELQLKLWEFFELLSFLNITFGAIIVKTRLIELLMLYHVFSPEEPVFFSSSSAPSFYLRSARLPSITSALECTPSTRHQNDSRTCCTCHSSTISIPEIYSKKDVLVQDWWARRLEGKDLPIGKTRVTTWTGLAMSTDWPVMTCAKMSYDSILFIVGLRDQPVQIPIDAPRLAEVFIPPYLIVSD